VAIVKDVSGDTEVGVTIGKIDYTLKYPVVWKIFVTVGEALVLIGRLPDETASKIVALLAPFEELLKPVLTMINGRQKQDATQSPKEPMRELFREIVEAGAKASNKIWERETMLDLVVKAQAYTKDCVIGGGPARDKLTQKNKMAATEHLGQMAKLTDAQLLKLAQGKLSKKELREALT